MNQQVNFYIGTCGFQNKHWKGIFYPEKLPLRKWFEHYCEHFNSLEINTTFYRFPTAARLELWYAKSPVDFKFSVKAPRLITHFKSFNDCERLLNDYYTACREGLKEKLGCTLFQMPAKIEYSFEKLDRIISCLDPAFQNVIEFRHVSWWNADVFDALADKNIIFCSISHPQLPTDFIANNPVFYLRLHGDENLYFSNYPTPKLKSFLNGIQQISDLKEAYVYFNNTASDSGILNAIEFKQMIETGKSNSTG